jgi:hypothetical protein
VRLYSDVAIGFGTGRSSAIDGKNVCRIGLERYASATVVSYDLVLVAFLTAVFVRSLLSSRAQLVSPVIRSVAIRSLVAAVLSMAVNGANVRLGPLLWSDTPLADPAPSSAQAIFLIVHPLELSYVCMMACGSDVIVNSWSGSRLQDFDRSGSCQADLPFGPAAVLFFATSQSERHHSSRDNEKREEAAIRALNSGKHSLTGPHLPGSGDGQVLSGTLRAPMRLSHDRSRVSFDDDDDDLAARSDAAGCEGVGVEDGCSRNQAASSHKPRADSMASSGSAELVALETLAYDGHRSSSPAECLPSPSPV